MTSLHADADALQEAVLLRAKRSAAQPDLKQMLLAISQSKRIAQRTRAVLLAARIVQYGQRMCTMLPRHRAVQ